MQGALVEVVRDLHEGREPAPIGDYYARTRDRLGTLFGASIVYGIGVVVGFLLLIVPGLIAIARWALIVPLVVIERLGVGEALARSNHLVRGQTGRVLAVVIVSAFITLLVGIAVRAVFGFLPQFAAVWIGGTISSAIAVPYQAHVLTVLYYKLTEPERPILPQGSSRETWRSIWDEEPRA